MRWVVTRENARHEVDARSNDGQAWSLVVGDENTELAVQPAGPNRWVATVGGKRHVFCAVVDRDQVFIQYNGWSFQYEVADARNLGVGAGADEAQGKIQLQMPGVVVRILVNEGDLVKAGDPVIVVEAMKMENEFKAPKDGVVTSIPVQEGQAVESGTVLMLLEDAEDDT